MIVLPIGARRGQIRVCSLFLVLMCSRNLAAAGDIEDLFNRMSSELHKGRQDAAKFHKQNVTDFAKLDESGKNLVVSKIVDAAIKGSAGASLSLMGLLGEQPGFVKVVREKWQQSPDIDEHTEELLVSCFSFVSPDSQQAKQLASDLGDRIQSYIAEGKLNNARGCLQVLPLLGGVAVPIIEQLTTGKGMNTRLRRHLIQASDRFCSVSPTILRKLKALSQDEDEYTRQYSVHALGTGAHTDNVEVRADITAFLSGLKKSEKDEDVRNKIDETLKWISEYQPQKKQVEIDPQDRTFPAVARCASVTAGDLLHYLEKSIDDRHLLGEETALAGVMDVLRAVNQTKKELRSRIDCRDFKRSISAVSCLLEIEKKVLAGEGNYWWKLRPQEEELSDKISALLREKNVVALAMRLKDVAADDVLGQIAVVEAVAAAAKSAKRDEKLEACRLLLAKYDAACAAVRLNCLHVARGILVQME